MGTFDLRPDVGAAPCHRHGIRRHGRIRNPRSPACAWRRYYLVRDLPCKPQITCAGKSQPDGGAFISPRRECRVNYGLCSMKSQNQVLIDRVRIRVMPLPSWPMLHHLRCNSNTSKMGASGDRVGDSWRSKRQKAQMDIGVSRRCAAPESGVMRHRAIGRGTAVAVRRVRVRGSSRAAGPRGRALPGSACASRGRVNDRRVRRDAEAEEILFCLCVSANSAINDPVASSTRGSSQAGRHRPIHADKHRWYGLATLVLLVESPTRFTEGRMTKSESFSEVHTG